jgi:hypothetical protein
MPISQHHELTLDKATHSVNDRRTGRVLSAGHPRMELPDSDVHLLVARRARQPDFDVNVIECLDAVSVVRTVVDRQVHFRTNRSVDGGRHEAALHAIARDRYPVLLDPEFEQNSSLLFQFVSPDSSTIIAADDEELVLTGHVNTVTGRQMPFAKLRVFAAKNQLTLVRTFDIGADPFEFLSLVESWVSAKGVIIRIDNLSAQRQHLHNLTQHIEVRSRWYVQQDFQLNRLSKRSILRICDDYNVLSRDDFRLHAAVEIGVLNEVLLSHAWPIVDVYVSARAAAVSRYDRFAAEVAAARERHTDNGEFARHFGADASRAFRLLRDDMSVWRTILRETLAEHFAATPKN